MLPRLIVAASADLTLTGTPLFAGRLGAITVILAVFGRSKPREYTYPEEDVATG